MPRCRARSRGSTAARCSPITPRRRAGTSSPSSTTTSSATPARPTACAIRRMRACFRKGRARRAQAELAAATHSLGGENDAPSRNISRFLDSLADRLKIGLDVRQIWRTDRFGRGGDHIPFLELGYPAARITVAIENYNWQHQDLRTENGNPLRRHDRPCRFPVSRQDDQAQRRRARRDRQRPAAAGAEGRGRGEHGYDADLGARCSRRGLHDPLAAHGRQPMGGVSRSDAAQATARTSARSSCPTSASTTGCSAFRR